MNYDRRPTRDTPHHLYLAGPFFNAAQIEIIQRIESALCRLPGPSGTFSFFSPRSQPLNANPTGKVGPLDTAKAQDVFKKDYLEITRSTIVLAVMDWALPEGKEVRMVDMFRQETENGESLEWGIPCSGPIKLPDSGTVWEMGCAYALRVPTYIFTQDPAARVNLMLSQSCKGVLYGWDALERWVASEFTEGAEPWKGEHR